MTARSARDVIAEALAEEQWFTYANGESIPVVEKPGDTADRVLAALVGAGLDAHDWLALIGIELVQQPDLWVYVGERVYVEGIPFGGWQEHGEGYHAARPVHEPSVPVYRLGLRGSEE